MYAPVRQVALILVALLLTACTSLHTIPGSPRDVVQQIGPRNVVRLTDKRGREVSLADVHVEGDSLVGVRSMASGERIALAIAEIDAVAVGEVDPVKTGLLLVGVPLALLAVLLTLFQASGGFKGT